ncbi:MAG TPA: hypothetical protein VG053_10350 [Solirubrobacteraceae bacterium]|nr:hypothetical protein [Solirubrobacteraceae bacterium]
MLHAILCLLPALTLAIPLLARRYPGERVLIALRSEPRARRARPRPAASTCRGFVLIAVRGGRLIGRSLAVRPPPVLAAASH